MKNVIALFALAFLLMVAAGESKSAAVVLPTDAIFAPTSFWYQPIPADAPTHPNSEGFKTDLLRQIKNYYGPNVAINTTSYSSPVYYTANANSPTEFVPVAVKNWLCGGFKNPYKRLEDQWTAVPMPSYAMPAVGTDEEMTIYDKANDAMYEFWHMRKDAAGQWSACWGGGMQGVSKSDGIWPPNWGATATGLPFLGGQITAEELRRGEIKHVMGIALVQTEDRSVLSWPAKRGDGHNAGKAKNRIPQGQRFRLDPTVDVDALKMSAHGKTIARAAQKYGFVVWDKAGAVTLRAQGRASYVNQENPYHGLFGGQSGRFIVLRGFPWERVQFLPHDYGKPVEVK